MSYISSGMNDTMTIQDVAGAAINKGAFHAVCYDSNGKIALAGDGVCALGLLLAETEENVKPGDGLTVQIKDIGLWKTGTAVEKGAELASDANGLAVPAVTGKFVLAVALESCTDAQVIQVQIIKAGYKA